MNQPNKHLDIKIKQEMDSFYNVNHYIDIRDMSGTWVVGRIIEINPEEMVLKIRIEGTKQENVRKFYVFFKNFFLSYQKYKINSERIAPYRMFTRSFF